MAQLLTNIKPVFIYFFHLYVTECLWTEKMTKKSLLHFILKFIVLISLANFLKCNIFIRISYTVMLESTSWKNKLMLYIKNSALAYAMWNSNWWHKWTRASSELRNSWLWLELKHFTSLNWNVYNWHQENVKIKVQIQTNSLLLQ